MVKPEKLFWREELCHAEVRPTAFIEDLLPKALTALLAKVDEKWLSSERLRHVRFGEKYLTEPISFVGTTRIEPKFCECHYYARALLTAQDFLNGRSDYDFRFGTLVIPQLAKLGQVLPFVATSVANADRKISSLYRGPSDEVASTMYEIMVAAASAKRGRQMQFEKTGHQKTPDLRVLDMEGVVVECKRKKLLTQYEQREEAIARLAFQIIRDRLRDAGLPGTIEIEFTVELESITDHEVTAVLGKLVKRNDNRTLYTRWAKLSWRRLSDRVLVAPTPLYSPKFLNTVFGWNDIPTHDGLICQVEAPKSLLVEEARFPVCLKWTSGSATALQKKTRAVSALVGEASGQVPTGETGIIYVCYSETARATIADLRTALIMVQMHEWTHSAKVRLPIMFVNRLYTSPVANGTPDMIENAVKLQANYADAGLFELFPAAVFTNVI